MTASLIAWIRCYPGEAITAPGATVLVNEDAELLLVPALSRHMLRGDAEILAIK
jgi:hypothetical protein